MQNYGDIVNVILLYLAVLCYTLVSSRIWDQQVLQKCGGTVMITETRHYTFEFIQWILFTFNK